MTQNPTIKGISVALSEESPFAHEEKPASTNDKFAKLGLETFKTLVITFAITAVFYAISRYNYILFHFLTELFSIVIAIGIFMIAWNSRRYMKNGFLIYLGIAFLFISIIDLFHTLSFKGMGVFAGLSTNISTQLWIAARFMQSASLFAMPLLLNKMVKINWALFSYASATALIFASIFYWRIFPTAYVEGGGLTLFKVGSEYVISGLLLAFIIFLYRKKSALDNRVYKFLTISAALTIISEMSSTLYVDIYGIFNMFSHLLKIGSFYLIYKALVQTSLMSPYQLMFKELQDSKESLQRIKREWERTFDSVPDLIAILDHKHKIIRINEAMANKLSIKPEECIGLDYHECAHGSRIPPADCLHVLAVADGNSHTSEIHDKKLNRDFLVSITPLKDGNGRIAGCVHVARDITERKKAEEEKNNFIAIMSHELRNPLTPILASSQLLRAHLARKSDNGQPKDPLVDESLSIIEQQAKNTAHLLDDLLDISRISRGKINLKKEVVDLSVCLKRALAATKPLMKKQMHDMTVSLPDAPLYLEADPVRLEQIVINLLNNSAKYTPPGGKISLEARRSGETAEIKVKDNGIGLDMEKIESIFNLYSRAAAPYTSTQGEMGIGLKLTKDLVTLHNGNINARSEGASKGCEFLINLPALPEKKVVISMDNIQLKNEKSNKIRVLIVDDNHSVANILAKMVAFMGYRTEVRHDGGSAIELAKEYKPQVAFIDIGLPGMSGYEIAGKMREAETNNEHKIKLVAITGYGQEEDKKRTREAGFDLHLVKPVEMSTLKEVLASVG